jgi:hypothetical protein
VAGKDRHSRRKSASKQLYAHNHTPSRTEHISDASAYAGDRDDHDADTD